MGLILAVIASYATIAIFFVALAINIKKYMATPMHLRWELYPVPGEEGHEHGGSFLEKTDWWKGDYKVSFTSEIKELFLEMFFIRRLYRAKRRTWLFSFLFHGGIYLIIGWFILIFTGAVTQIAGLPVSVGAWEAYPSAWSTLIFYLTIGFGYIGVSAGIAGATGLLLNRLFDDRIRDLSAPVDFFNLSLVLAVLISGAIALTVDPQFDVARAFIMLLLNGGIVGQLGAGYASQVVTASNTLIIIQILLLCALFVYIPFTRMTHFLGKYFTYHRIQWDSEPTMKLSSLDSTMEQKIEGYLDYKIQWAAKHSPKGKTWREVDNDKGQN